MCSGLETTQATQPVGHRKRTIPVSQPHGLPAFRGQRFRKMEKEGIVRDTIPQLPSTPGGEGGLFSRLSPRAVGGIRGI